MFAVFCFSLATADITSASGCEKSAVNSLEQWRKSWKIHQGNGRRQDQQIAARSGGSFEGFILCPTLWWVFKPFDGKACYVLVAEFQVHLLHCKWTAWADSKCLLWYKTKKPQKTPQTNPMVRLKARGSNWVKRRPRRESSLHKPSTNMGFAPCRVFQFLLWKE